MRQSRAAILLASLVGTASLGLAAQGPVDPQANRANFPHRCLTPDRASLGNLVTPPGDCSANSTTIKSEYAPGEIYEVPVVVHVITRTNGTGDITDAKVQSQIDILNQDFRALAGSNGAPGVDTGIQFKLATVDPNGNPTNGITRSANNTWFNDGGSYWNTLNWDPDRYLNIYTNSASGALGYVPYLPQSGNAGNNSDRVVVLWSSFGLNGPIGPPYNKGRTTTHEVGHYLGLYHTFDGGCGQANNPYGSGDLVGDTNRESNPSFGCPTNKSSCSSPDPIRNYMDYSDDLCMNNFTLEQANRMRCTLLNWRPMVFEVLSDGLGQPYCSTNINSSGLEGELVAVGSPMVSDNDVTFTASSLPSNQNGYLLMSRTTDNVPNFGGSFGTLCLGSPQYRFTSLVQNSGSQGETTFGVNLGNLPSGQVFLPGETWHFQYWTRDFVLSPTSNTTLGYSITWQ